MRRSALLLASLLALGAAAWTLWPQGRDGPRRPPHPSTGLDPSPAPPPGLAPAPPPTPPTPSTDAPASPQAAPDATTGLARLRVHVRGVTRDGKPTGVRVHVRDAAGRETTREPGADGDAVFADLPPGAAHAWIDAPGFVGTEPEAIELRADREQETTHELRAGARVTGRVVAARTGAPVVGASVDAEDGGALEGMSSAGMRASYGPVLTDGDGRFETALLPLGAIVTVTARARGFRSTGTPLRLLAVDGARAPIELRLEPGGTVRGRVLAPDGRGVPDAEAFVFPEAWAEVRENPRVIYWRTDAGTREAIVTRCDAEGRFEVDGLPLGVPLCATALHRPFARATDACGVTLTESAPEASVTVRLRASAAVVVRLRDPEGRPIVEGQIEVGEGFGETRGQLDEAGTARVTGLAPGPTVLGVYVDGFVPVREEVTLGEGETLERTLRLSRGLSISGAVLDEAEVPVEGASVQASREGARRSPVARTRTAADGTFRIEGLEPGSHRIGAHANGMVIRQTEWMSVPATGVRLVAQRLVEVRARLVAPPGAAPSEVTLGSYDDHGGSASGEGWRDGRTVWTLARGTWRLTVHAPGFATIERRVTVTTSEGLDLGDLPLEAGATLEGVVVAPDGRGLAGVTLEATDPDQASAQTGTDGRFRLEHLRRTKVTVVVTAPGFRPGEVAADLSTPQAPVRVVLARGALVTASWKPVEGVKRLEDVYLRATQLGVPEDEAVVEHGDFDDGSTCSMRLPGGRFALELLADEKVLWRQEVTLEEGKDLALEIPVPAR